jgi:NADH-quinone oxidoreductase subunit A
MPARELQGTDSAANGRITRITREDSMPAWSLPVYLGAVALVVVAMLALSAVLGERQPRARAVVYEAGMLPSGSARVRLSARFYLVAVFFVIFDLEAVFLFAWALAARELGWTGYWAMFVFVVILGATLAYLWRSGALDWVDVRRHTRY